MGKVNLSEECIDCEYNYRDYGCINHDCEIFKENQAGKEWENPWDTEEK